MALISDIPENSWCVWPSHPPDCITVIYTVFYMPMSSRVIVTHSSVLWRIINTTHTHTHAKRHAITSTASLPVVQLWAKYIAFTFSGCRSVRFCVHCNICWTLGRISTHDKAKSQNPNLRKQYYTHARFSSILIPLLWIHNDIPHVHILGSTIVFLGNGLFNNPIK